MRPKKLTTVNGQKMDGGTHEAKIELQFEAHRDEQKFAIKTSTTFTLADLSNTGIDGILSLSWYAQRKALVDPADNCLIFKRGWLMDQVSAC